MGKKRILVIDDEEDFARMIKLNLELTGQYEVRTITKGLLGVDVAKEFKPDLIFLDIMMPDVDGAKLGHELENDNETKDIPVVFLTAIVNKEEVAKNKGAIGGHPFIAKPVTAKDLIDYIEKRTAKI